jgi:hypothetical protein
MKRKKEIFFKLNLSELRKYSEILGVEVWEFSPIHLRIVGKNLVDFWPTTGKAWMLGSYSPARIMTALQVCELALDENTQGSYMSPEQISHMKEILYGNA